MRRLPLALLLAVAAAGCSHSGATTAPSTTAASSSSPVASEAEPTGSPSDGVDLPAPAAPSTPAASTAGSLTQRSLPLPTGWRAVADKGGSEKGYLGNGTPAHARDPRYAAYEMMAVGCAPVHRNDWTDPTSALEVDLQRGAAKGIGDVMTFRSAADAKTWFGLWQAQVKACHDGPEPHTSGTGTATTWLGSRSYADGSRYRETAAVSGDTVRLYALPWLAGSSDAEQRQLLARITAAG